MNEQEQRIYDATFGATFAKEWQSHPVTFSSPADHNMSTTFVELARWCDHLGKEAVNAFRALKK